MVDSTLFLYFPRNNMYYVKKLVSLVVLSASVKGSQPLYTNIYENILFTKMHVTKSS